MEARLTEAKRLYEGCLRADVTALARVKQLLQGERLSEKLLEALAVAGNTGPVQTIEALRKSRRREADLCLDTLIDLESKRLEAELKLK